MAIRVTAIPTITPFGTPSLTFTQVDAPGSDLTAIRTDADIRLFDGIGPSGVPAMRGGTGGTASFPSRRDHRHALSREYEWFAFIRLFGH